MSLARAEQRRYRYYRYFQNTSSQIDIGGALPGVGGAFGGPIIKNKFFIFGAVDVLRSSTTSAGQYTPYTLPGPGGAVR